MICGVDGFEKHNNQAKELKEAEGWKIWYIQPTIVDNTKQDEPDKTICCCSETMAHLRKVCIFHRAHELYYRIYLDPGNQRRALRAVFCSAITSLNIPTTSIFRWIPVLYRKSESVRVKGSKGRKRGIKKEESEARKIVKSVQVDDEYLTGQEQEFKANQYCYPATSCPQKTLFL